MSEKNRAAVGDRLREERDRTGLSQDQFAAALDVSRRTLVAWERGEQSPNADALTAAAEVGVDVLYVLIGQRSVPVESRLTPDEVALLDNYKHSDEEGRAAARRVLSSLAKQKVG